MLNFKFSINPRDVKVVYCRSPTYILHDVKIISEYIFQLENNIWIKDCTRYCGALLLLTTKSHQKFVR